MRLFFGGMSHKTTTDDLTAHVVEQVGSSVDVLDTVIIVDKNTGRSKGFGFVEMDALNNESVKDIVAALNNSHLHGRQLTVNEARPMTARDRKHEPKQDNKAVNKAVRHASGNRRY